MEDEQRRAAKQQMIDPRRKQVTPRPGSYYYGRSANESDRSLPPVASSPYARENGLAGWKTWASSQVA